jgi:EpsI family protein
MTAKKFPMAVMVAAAMMVGAAVASQALRPTIHLSDIKPKLVLRDLVPANFGEWRELPSVMPVLPDPTVQATMNSLYSQTLARAYVNRKGELLMMSIAYGSDQNSEATAAHRPEFCYQGSGMTMSTHGTRLVPLPGRQLEMRQLKGVKENYTEHIAYWVTLDEHTTLPGMGRKLAQLRYGLRGQIADGLLFRVSSPGADPEAAARLQDQFVKDLFEQVPNGFKSRIFGA